MSSINNPVLTQYKIDAVESDYLFVQPSTIKNAGDGLFTAIKIYTCEIIAVFRGIILSPEEVEFKILKKRNAYFIDMPDGSTLDCARTKCFAKYANDAEGPSKTNKKNNAIITLNSDDQVCLVAIRNINAGREVLCGYGRAYWSTKSEGRRAKKS